MSKTVIADRFWHRLTSSGNRRACCPGFENKQIADGVPATVTFSNRAELTAKR
jgi:hypothetical protein